jgi:flavin-dependent dehydrogenase
MSERKRLDVVVVGAGIAGSACASLLARGGRSVALVDRRAIGNAGARWVNGVPLRGFDEAGLARPTAPELRKQGHPFVVASPSGRVRRRVVDNPILEIDMRLLGERLRDDAKRAGAIVLDETTIDRVRVDGDRPRAIDTRPHGSIEATLFVDASGLPAVVRRAVFPRWPDVPKEHLCLAAQHVRRIADDAKAAEFLARNEIGDGETFARVGTHGGYSVLNLRVDRREKEVSVLTGAVPDAGTNGVAMIDELVAREPWIGETIFGGAGALPLRRPYARLVAPGLALLGDAGCQMFPAHGSGIAIGMIAARMLADAVLDVPAQHAGDEDVLWRYAARFHRTHGANLVGYDLVRRMAQAFSRDEGEALFEAGLATDATTRATLAQELPAFDARELLETAKAATRAPLLAAKVGAVLARFPLVMAHAKTYPSAPSLRTLAAWERAAAALVGDVPDPIQ